MAEISKIINGYHIYISGTWCEVTKNGLPIYDGSVEEGMTAEEVYRQITKRVVFSYKGKELRSYAWLYELNGERKATRGSLAIENSCSMEEIQVSFRYAEM